MESKELAIRLARALDAKKGYNIRILHVDIIAFFRVQREKRL